MSLRLTSMRCALYRVARLPFAWRWPVADLDADAQVPDCSGNRWDAPAREFKTLYFADSPVLAFVEKFAAFRGPVTGDRGTATALPEDAAADLSRVSVRPRLPASVFQAASGSGLVAPRQVRAHAHLLHGRFVDVDHGETHAALSRALGGQLERYGFSGFDRGVLMTQDRRITRTVAAWLYEQTKGAGVVGIQYECRLVPGTCYAMWDRADANLIERTTRAVTLDDEDLLRAVEILAIDIDPET